MTETPETLTPEQRRSRRIMLVIAVLFIGPVLVAAAIHFLSDGWRPDGRTNNGELMSPVVRLPALPVTSLIAGELEPEETLLHGTWWLVHAQPEGCHQACAEAVYLTRQIWLAMGRRNAAVRRLLLSDGMPAAADEFRAAHPDLYVAAGPETDALLAALDGVALEDAEVYLVDPAGQLVLVYRAGYAGKGMIEDIKKLLKLTRI